MLSFEHVLSAYLNNHRIEYSHNLVYLCAPFIYSLRLEEEMYYSFESFMNILSKNPNLILKIQ